MKHANTADIKEGSIFTSMISKGKDLSNINCSMFSTQRHTHTVRGGSTLKDDINERAFPCGSFRELKIALKGIKGFCKGLTRIFISKGFVKHEQVKISDRKEFSSSNVLR